MGSVLDLPVTVANSPARARPSDLLRRRRQLVDIRKAEKTRRHNAGQDEIALQIEAMIGLLTHQITELDRTIAQLIEEDQTLFLTSPPSQRSAGHRPDCLTTLLGELPELGTLDRRRIASLAGLAPHARESGTWRGARRVRGGRRKVREALYIAALIASRRIPSLIAVRDRMRAKGTAPKTILNAVARQLLVILNAMLRKNTPLAT